VPKDLSRLPDASTVRRWAKRRLLSVVFWLKSGTLGRLFLKSSRELPRIGLVFRFRQCDNEDHGWCEGPPPTVACKVSIRWPGLHPPGKSISDEKRILLSSHDRDALM